MQELGDDEVGDLVVHGRAQEDDPLVEEPGVDVERALPAGGLLDDHRYEWAHGPRFVSLRALDSFSQSDGRRPLPRGESSNGLRAAGSVLDPIPEGPSGARSPELGSALGLLLAGRPELVARLGLLDRD